MFAWLAAIIFLVAALLQLQIALTTPIKVVTQGALPTLLGGSPDTTTTFIQPTLASNSVRLSIAFLLITLMPIVFLTKKTLKG